jgi:hypothetical protein
MRPRRYPHDPRLSSIVDQLVVLQESLEDRGDYENAIRIQHARLYVVEVALGVKGG